MPRSSMTGKAEVNDPPRKGVIGMITGGPVGGDSQRARTAPGTRSLWDVGKRSDGRGAYQRRPSHSV
ncbi:UNVERIFIED_CONTAM: hypothetical protein Slati_0413200 [Sesamum latifolium]|uniref:Uncharacterized protein n=1 Tax=Sesamum latifolium TaxID=2727402 RepID=A0AAW2Y046_9LAMI